MRYIKKHIILEEVKGKVLFRLILSDKLLDIVKRVSKNNDIAKNLISDVETAEESDMTYIDVTEKDDTVTFKPSSKVTTDEFESWTKGRNEIKIGRLVKKMYNTKYSDKQIEEFVNLYKSAFKGDDIFSKFEIVSGEDILFWYNVNNYVEGRGSLNKSCMKYDYCGEYLKFYSLNPEVVSMLIYKSDDNLLLGRALIWKLKKPEGFTFMDRIYTVNDSDIQLFIDYANKHEYIYKKYQTYGADSISSGGNVSTYLKVLDYKKYPYCDTLRYYDPNTGLLTSDEENEIQDIYLLESTDGLFTEPNNMGWDDWNDCERNRDQLVYCERNSGYCYVDDAIYLEYKNIYAYPNDDVVYSNVEGANYFSEDCVFSDKLEDWILEDNAVTAYLTTDKDGDTDYFHKNSKGIVKIDGDYYINDICVMVNGEWKFKNNGIIAYQREDIYYSFMTKEDAEKYNIVVNDKYLIFGDTYDNQKLVGIKKGTDKLGTSPKMLGGEVYIPVYHFYKLNKKYDKLDLVEVVKAERLSNYNNMIQQDDFKLLVNNLSMIRSVQDDIGNLSIYRSIGEIDKDELMKGLEFLFTNYFYSHDLYKTPPNVKNSNISNLCREIRKQLYYDDISDKYMNNCVIEQEVDNFTLLKSKVKSIINKNIQN